MIVLKNTEFQYKLNFTFKKFQVLNYITVDIQCPSSMSINL